MDGPKRKLRRFDHVGIRVSRREKALIEQDVTHEIEWHPGALHGFGVPGSNSYHKHASERVWERTQALFGRTLR